jgi:hypothetical protein
MTYGTINADLITTSDGVSAAGLYGMKNRIINGDMRIDQRNAGASVTPTVGTFTLDRWAFDLTQASKCSIQQNAGSVTPPVGFTNYLGVTSTSAYSVASGDTFLIRQAVEGFNVADLNWGTANASTVTLSFWVRSSLTGTFGGAFTNSANNRSYPFTYTINSANTWEYETITIAGDTSGTWLTTNGTGVFVRFGLGSGSTFSGTAGAWGAGNIVQPTGTVSVVGTNGATFYITGVQLEKGTTATSFDYRPYGTELSLCQRYYYRITSGGIGNRIGMGQVYASTNALGYTSFPVPMRVAPSALDQTGTAANYQITNSALAAQNCSAVPAFNSADVFQANTIFTVASGLTAGNACLYVTAAANVYLGWSAEL